MRLVIVDTAQIQPYIFGSNRLRENVGASHLVASATEKWALEAVKKVSHNILFGKTFELDDTQKIEDPKANLDAEVLYAGGGNFVVLFREDESAKSFTRELSCRALEEAPNLQLVITHSQEPLDWDNGSLFGTVQETFKSMAKEKRERAWSAPLLGLGVTAMCRSTGLPAVGYTESIEGDLDSIYPASAEILCKHHTIRKANDRLRDYIEPPAGYAYPTDFEHLGSTKGEFSYIAVVHADGNGVGQMIMRIGEAHKQDNRAYITAIRDFSRKLEEAAQAALKTTLARVEPTVTKDENGIKLHEINGKERERQNDEARWHLPFRPVVFGGDDVTFVCDGRLGLSLAVEYLSAFEQETANCFKDLPIDVLAGQDRITACAGIAIVKSHYPFARAYALANELTDSAKKYRRKNKAIKGSCLDWHFAMSGLSGSIEEIRRREYTARERDPLTLRPVTLDDNPVTPLRSWPVIREGIYAFQGEQWAGRRNKIKALRDALREGRDAVKHFRAKFNENKPLPNILALEANLAEEGWQSGCCGYFDAVELSDWFIPLEGGSTDGTASASKSEK